MLLKHNYTYLNNEDLIEKGYAECGVCSLNFDRYLDEDERNENQIQSQLLDKESWNLRCDEFSKYIYNQMLPIKEILNSKYDIHQISEEKSSNEHYRSDWDLFYYTNKGWNGKDYFDYMRISFNEKRSFVKNFELLNEIINLLENMDIKNVYCWIQYHTIYHEAEIKAEAESMFNKIKDKFVDYQGSIGKIKITDTLSGYGFFKKGSKSRYYPMSDKQILSIVI